MCFCFYIFCKYALAHKLMHARQFAAATGISESSPPNTSAKWLDWSVNTLSAHRWTHTSIEKLNTFNFITDQCLRWNTWWLNLLIMMATWRLLWLDNLTMWKHSVYIAVVICTPAQRLSNTFFCSDKQACSVAQTGIFAHAFIKIPAVVKKMSTTHCRFALKRNATR